jgi:hypothetical protein
LGFAVWIDKQEQVVWAQGTHEYRPMGAAVVAVSDLFRARDFRQSRQRPSDVNRLFVGFFASLEEVNRYLGDDSKTRRFRETPAHLI